MATGAKKRVMVRFVHSKINQRARTDIFVDPNYWDAERQMIIMPRGRLMTDEIIKAINELREVDAELRDLTNYIIDCYTSNPDGPAIDKEWLKNVVHTHKVGEPQPVAMGYFEAWELFMQSKVVSKKRMDMYHVSYNMLHRF